LDGGALVSTSGATGGPVTLAGEARSQLLTAEAARLEARRGRLAAILASAAERAPELADGLQRALAHDAAAAAVAAVLASG
jgi:hypothetical protein